jgi:hypothetical protein
MTDTELLAQAKQVTPRREDRSFNEAELLKNLANLLDSSRRGERGRQAENIIDHHCRDGSVLPRTARFVFLASNLSLTNRTGWSVMERDILSSYI